MRLPVWHLPTVPYEYNLHSHLSLVPRGFQSVASPDHHAISLNKKWHTVSPWSVCEVNKEPTLSQQRITKAPPLSHGPIDKDRITFMGKTESLKLQVTTTADLWTILNSKRHSEPVTWSWFQSRKNDWVHVFLLIGWEGRTMCLSQSQRAV